MADSPLPLAAKLRAAAAQLAYLPRALSLVWAAAPRWVAAWVALLVAQGLLPAAALLDSLGSLAQNGLTLVAMGAVLLPYGVWLPAALFASTLPAFWVVLHFTLRQHRWRLRATADERRTWYYDWLLTSAEAAP